jgi:uncharacterized repeat protein (TIGR01451 family)
VRTTERTEMTDSKRFAAICEAVLQAGVPVRFRARGRSMQPNVLDGDVVEIAPAAGESLRRGDIALTRTGDALLLHRAIGREAVSGAIVTRGDAGLAQDQPPDAVWGKVISIERGGRRRSADGRLAKLIHAAHKHAHRVRRAILLRAKRFRHISASALLILFAVYLHAPAARAQFTLSNSAAPANVTPGGTITFTQVLTATRNFTPSGARPVRTTQTIPANTSYTGYSVADNSGGNWACAPAAPIAAGGTLTCTDTAGAYANGTTTTFTITMTVANGTAIGTVITDTVNSNRATSASASSTVIAPTGNVDLSMTQAESPNPVATGGQITYTETVTNNDTTYSAAGASLTQNTPTNTTFTSATPPAGWTCGTVPAVGGTGAITCTSNSQLNPNTTTGNFTIVVTVNAAAPVGSTITSTATVSETGGTDPNLSNNTTTTTTTVSGADLSMTQSVSPTAVAPGSQITYTETVTNNGPDAAVGAVLYQETPANTTFSSITPPAGWTCGTQPAVGGTGQVICTANTNVGSGVASGTFTYVVTVNAATAAGTTIINPADVTAQTTDSVPSNNATVTSVLVETSGDSDLSISMTAAPTPVFVSSQLSYTIQLQNLGLSAAGNVTVTDTLPATLVNPTATASQGSCAPPSGGQIVCTIGTVAYPLGAAISITVTGTTPGTATTLTNSVTVATSGTDPVSSNNTATVLTVVQPLVCATPGKDGAPGIPLSGYVNTYYAGVGSVGAGSTSLTVVTPSSGSATQIAVGDLLLVMQMQGVAINSTNTSSYGNGNPGYPAAGWTSLGSAGEFEFVTVSSVTVNANTDTLTIIGSGANGGLLNSYATVAASATQGQQTFQVIRVPQYSSATLSSSLAAFPWNGSVGGVLALDIASQLTLGGTVTLDGDGFRGGGGISLSGSAAGANTDTVTTSPATLPNPPPGAGANGSKGEGIAGTPHWVAPSLSSITPGGTATAVSTGQAYTEGLPNGSFARGAPGNAGGGATDANPAANDQNDGGGGGANGGTGGQGGFAWSSANVVGGFGGVAFPASTNAVVMGGGGGAGTSNNGAWWDPATNTGNANCGASCTGVFSSGTAGGGIVIIRAGSVTGTGTISASGQNALDEENDAGGGGGAGGSIMVYANSGSLTGLTAIANGGNGGSAWPEVAPGAFPGNRHGPGAGGGGGVILTSSAPGSADVSGGQPGNTTLADDAYGATSGQPGIVAPGQTITETPGSQSGAHCAGADLAVTNVAAPNPVVAGGQITYTQTVTNAGPQDAVNATASEQIPANTTFQSIAISGADATGWSCTTPSVGGTGAINCTNPDVPSGSSGTATFTVVVSVNPATVSGTQIADTISVASGTNDPNLANNSATAVVIVAAANTADLTITNSASPNPVLAGGTISYTIVVSNAGPASASSVFWSSATPANTTLVSVAATSGTGGWTCSLTSISCSIAAFAPGASTTFTVTVTVNPATPSGTVIKDTATVSSSTTDPNPSSNSATATVVVATAGQADLAVTKTGTPNPVLAGNTITYTITVTNNGPAPALNVKLVDTLPANTTFTSITYTPLGTWTCSGPSGGAETCTNPSLIAGPAGTTTFTLTMKVNAGTAPGTFITNTATVSATTSDPTATNNTATATSVVASPTQADVAIVKTASPEPVNQGTSLTYTLQVTNNGPAVATNLTVTDPLPSQVTFDSVSIPSSQGTCSQSAGTVTCNIPSLSVGGLVIITINTTASTFSSNTFATNTASVTAATSDPNLTNNTSTAISTIESPTAVDFDSLQAQLRPGGGVVLQWRTREETRNLGFHVYRDDATGRHRLDPSIIAGSALFFRGGLPQHRARTYEWIDPQGSSNVSYWVEDVDLNGTSTLHGPVYAEGTAQSSPRIAQSQLLTQLNQRASATQPSHLTHSLTPQMAQFWPFPKAMGAAWLNDHPAVKISVSAEGWYRVTGAQLAAAGLPANANVRGLALFAEGVEQPLLIDGAKNGPLGPTDAIEFYGTPIDTPFSGTRVYWLISGWRPGTRIAAVAAGANTAPSGASFPFSVLFQQRTTYFAALLNGENNDNFFGAIVSTTPVDQVLTIAHMDPNSAIPTTLAVTLQGVTQGQEHRVDVVLNGVPLGEMDYTGQANTTSTFTVDAGVTQNGSNTVTLTAMDGDYDVSLVQSIQLTYAHTYSADSNWLRASATSGDTIRIDGFTQPTVSVFDVTNPAAVEQLNAPVTWDGLTFGVTLTVDGPVGTQRTLLAFSADQISAPEALSFHAPSTLGENTAGANYIVITHPDFLSSVAPLVKQHESDGESVAIVTTDQIFDAYNYGEPSPFALRDYLQFAATKWSVHPNEVLLVGDASFDPRNYLGFGDFDFVPTRMIETAAFKTASDDWLTDFNQTGFATIPTGRLPVRTPDEAALVVSKIVNYESGAAAGGSWQNRAVMIADQNIDANFSAETNAAAAVLPRSFQVTKILADGQDPNVVHQQILNALNTGALLVNYTGHGSEEQWSFADIFNDSTASALTNGNQLPMYLLMDCLNGFFHDVYATSLSTSLMLAPNGGAVAVWASSGFTDAPPQATMDQAFLSAWAANPGVPIGVDILSAKAGITDPDVRRTWILFGDPEMRLQPPAASPTSVQTRTPAPRPEPVVIRPPKFR